jgi:hypothetical protein
VLRTWTLFLGKERVLSKSDIDKFHDAVERTDSTLEGVDIWNQILAKPDKNGKPRTDHRRTLVFPEGKLSPNCHPIQPILFRNEEMSMAMEAMEYSEFNGWKLPPWLIRYRIDPEVSSGVYWPFGYVDHRIQSDGKVRWFYAAPPWQNEMFKHYSRSLYDFLRSVHEDCTFDQDKGVRKVHAWLQEGKIVHSIDLSSATDSFPWEVTKLCLENLSSGKRSHQSWNMFLTLYESLVLKPGAMIRSPKAGERTHVTWTKGQPLGAQASFAMFALSHHFLVRLAFRRATGQWGKHKDQYVVLGDDIVITNTGAAGVYRRMCKDLGIPISEHKSVSSPRVAEFGGRLILPQATAYKFKAFNVVPENLHSAISILGQRAVRACAPSFARNVMALIPQRGYNGTNPGGFPHNEVVAFYKYLFTRLKLDEVDLSFDMYASRSQVSSRCAINRWNIEWNPKEVSKDLPVPHFNDDPVTGVVWKWKPFIKRRVYSEIIRVARSIFKES